MTEKVYATHNQENCTIWAGYECSQPPFPKRYDHNFFFASEVDVEGNVVKGYMNFPERGYFEFDGPISKLCKSLKSAGGARAVLGIKGFTWWMNS